MELKYLSKMILDRAQAELARQNRKTAQALEMADIMCTAYGVLKSLGYDPLYVADGLYPAWMTAGGEGNTAEALTTVLSPQGYALYGARRGNDSLCLRARHEDGIHAFDIIFVTNPQ